MKKQFTYKFDELYATVIQALNQLGGSGTTTEIADKVAELLKLTEAEINDLHRGTRTKLTYRLAWTRNYLKRIGVIENPSHGLWVLTPLSREFEKLGKKEINKRVKAIDRTIDDGDVKATHDPQATPKETWEDELLEVIKNLKPAQFERLCQRLLRSLGFIEVEVTGKSGDGGIDGKGILRLGGVISFHIVFQAKRYAKNVSPSLIRGFRGAMTGRVDKGLLITTGNFSKAAKAEAAMGGTIPVDIIDGSDLIDKLKDLRLGVSVQQVENVIIQKDWFRDI